MKREISILNLLYGYPFFPRLYSVFEFYDRLCLLMDFCGGGEMFRWIRQAKGLSCELVKFYGAEILLALRKLRSLNILHRDLKSENVMLTVDGHVELVDFGLSICTESKAWMSVGTAECMAPEVVMSNGYGPESDLWSFGILLYEMVHCKTPFVDQESAVDDVALRKNILRRKPFFREDLEKDYVSLVEGLLNKNPKKRLGYESIEEVMRHSFFEGTNWEDMEKLHVKPPVSPKVSYDGDAKYFDFYRESIVSFDFPPMNVMLERNPELASLFNS